VDFSFHGLSLGLLFEISGRRGQKSSPNTQHESATWAPAFAAGKSSWDRLPVENPSIGATIEEVLASIIGEKSSVVGSGRTDSGARLRTGGALWNAAQDRDTGVLQRALNSRLPTTIRVLKVARVRITFMPSVPPTKSSTAILPAELGPSVLRAL
jgi:hypothetical protein